MKRIWILDLLAAALFYPVFLPMLLGAFQRFEPDDIYFDDRYIVIDPLLFSPVVLSFAIAALWSGLRPDQAFRAQVVPAVTSSVLVALLIYLARQTSSSMP
jgi:uncharacterized membrane protein